MKKFPPNPSPQSTTRVFLEAPVLRVAPAASSPRTGRLNFDKKFL